MSALIAEIGMYLIGAIAVALGVFGYGVKKKSDGLKEAETKTIKDALDKVMTSNDIDDEIDALEPDDVKRRLFDKYGKQ